MAKKVSAKSKNEPDSTYFLKVLMYFVLGTIWLRFNGHTVLPLGLLIGLLFAKHEHFQIDRKIEYVVLIISALIGLMGLGLFLSFYF
jgi:hypothetical protein